LTLSYYKGRKENTSLFDIPCWTCPPYKTLAGGYWIFGNRKIATVLKAGSDAPIVVASWCFPLFGRRFTKPLMFASDFEMAQTDKIQTACKAYAYMIDFTDDMYNEQENRTRFKGLKHGF
jgi:hypothetical protein